MNLLYEPYEYMKNIYNEQNIVLNFLFSTFIYCVSYPCLYYFLNSCFYKFKKYDKDKKFYIVSNVLKYLVLNIVSYFFLAMLLYDLDLFNLQNWYEYDKLLKNLSSLYVCTDIISIFLNWGKMKSTTFYHHICTTLALIYICSIDFNHNGVNKAIVIYGGFSSLAGIVNLFLGIRFLIENKFCIYYLTRGCFFIYLFICFFNWSWQFYYLVNLMIYENYTLLRFLENFFYITMLYFWIYDDLVLMKYLKNYKY